MNELMCLYATGTATHTPGMSCCSRTIVQCLVEVPQEVRGKREESGKAMSEIVPPLGKGQAVWPFTQYFQSLSFPFVTIFFF